MKNRSIKVSLIAALVAASISGAGAYAQEKTVDQKLEDLEQQIKILQRQREVDKEVADAATKEQQAKAKTIAIAKASQDGFNIQSADGNFNVKLKAVVQADARTYLADTARLGTDTFLLRRARPIIEGTLFRDFDFRVMGDIGNGAATANLLQDAYLEWKYFPWAKVRAGKFKPEVGLEQQQNDVWLFFAERGLPSDLIPNRDVGFQLSGDLLDGTIHYAGGIYNGVVDGGIADLDTFDSKDGAARIFVRPFKTTEIGPLKGLGFGFGGTIGNQQSTSTTTNLASYKTTGQNTFYTFRSGVAANGLEIRGTPQAYYYWGPLGLFGEWVYTDQEIQRLTVHDHVRNTAWQVQGSVVLTGEDAGYAGVTPKHPFDLKAGGWGAFELVARYGNLRFDPTSFSTTPLAADQRFADPTRSAQEARQWGVGLNWYLNKNVKLVLNYEQTQFDGGAGSTGATTYTVKDRQIERVLITRAQFTF